ncbi:MAG: LysR family transcriptional regulator [Rheinheimera sp.]|nr:LysR family transcriptional regulator [Rheinheimera sp.]
MALQPVLTLEALRALDAIDRKGSFAAAAESLYKVPSALSYTIARLESDLDVQLFDRSRQKAQLTQAGMLLLQQGRHLLLASRQLEEAVRQLDTGWERQLVIAVDSVVPLQPLFSLIDQFHQLGRLTQIMLTEQVMAGGWEALQSGRADVAVGLSGEGVSGQFQLQQMAQMDFVFAVAPHHELAQLDRVVTQQDLQQQTAIVVSDSALDLPARDSGLYDSRRRVLVSSMQAKIAAQQAGLGVGFLPKHLISQAIQAGSLIDKACEVPRAGTMMYLGWRRRAQPGQALLWFIQQLSQYDWAAVFHSDITKGGDVNAIG